MGVHLEEGHHCKEAGAVVGLGIVEGVAVDHTEVDMLVEHN